MARRKVSPEAQIIALFTGLSDESKRMVMFGLNAITTNEAPRLPAAQPRKKAVKEVTPEKKEPMCAVCANPADHPDHDTTYLSSHPFALSVPKKSGRKSGAARSTQNSEIAMAAASGVAHAGD